MGTNDIQKAYTLYNDNHNNRSIDYISSPYYTNNIPKPTLRPTKILLQENTSKSDEEKILIKNECSRTGIKTEELIKTELNGSAVCRTTTNHGSNILNPSYDSYLNHDSNSSSVSSMDTLNQNHQYPLNPENHLQITNSNLGPPHNVHNSSSVYMLDEKRLVQQHHTNYDTSSMVYNNMSDDIYQQHDRAFTLNNINRPVPSYSNEMTCGYDSRTYDPNTPYDRYETTSAQSCERYPPQYSEQNIINFHHQQQPHLQPSIKSDQCQHHEQQPQNITPVYPR